MPGAAEIISAFDEEGIELDTGVPGQCAALLSSCGKSPAELAIAWTTYCLNRKMMGSMELMKLDHLEAFRLYLTEEQNKNKRRHNQSMNASNFFYGKDDLDDLDMGDTVKAFDFSSMDGTPSTLPPSKRVSTGMPPKSPSVSTPDLHGGSGYTPLYTPAAGMWGRGGSTPQPQWSAATAASTARAEGCGPAGGAAGGVGGSAYSKRVPRTPAQKTGLHLELPVVEAAGGEPCTVELLQPGRPGAAHIMNDTLSHKVTALEDQVVAFAEAVMEQEGLEKLHPVHVACQERAVVCGRVVCDGEGRLNDRAVLLEGSMRHSAGARIRLDLRDVPAFSLFPGQVVAAEGTNPTGHCFVVSRLITSCPAPAPPPAGPSGPLSVVLAAGPFCSPEDLLYEPLGDVLAYAAAHAASLVVLMGPFVDADHPAVKTGALDVTFQDLFDLSVRQKVEAFCKKMAGSSRVVLVPSSSDAVADPVYPQPSLPTEGWEAEAVLSAPNPAFLRCDDDLTLAASSQDILLHLSGSEANNIKGDDRMARLLGHLVAQQSMYPLCPPAPGARVDSSAIHHARLPLTPHLIILPSNLTPFAKLVTTGGTPPGEGAGTGTPPAKDKAGGESQKVVCINPGRLTKGVNGGTFAHVHVAAADGDKDTANRTRVEIVHV